MPRYGPARQVLAGEYRQTRLPRLDSRRTRLIGALRSSKIGVYIKLLSMHRKETDSNKRMASALVEKWSRPIFNSTVSFRAQDVEAVQPRFNAHELAAQAEEKVKSMGNTSADVVPEQKRSGGVTKNGTMVPRPLGMDFHVQPSNSVKATASDKYRKHISPQPSPLPGAQP